MTEFPPLRLPDSMVEMMKRNPPKSFFSEIEGVQPLVGPLKVTHITFTTVNESGKVISCSGTPCDKERCRCGYYDQAEIKCET